MRVVPCMSNKRVMHSTHPLIPFHNGGMLLVLLHGHALQLCQALAWRDCVR